MRERAFAVVGRYFEYGFILKKTRFSGRGQMVADEKVDRIATGRLAFGSGGFGALCVSSAVQPARAQHRDIFW